jgi:hypothetical protein
LHSYKVLKYVTVNPRNGKCSLTYKQKQAKESKRTKTPSIKNDGVSWLLTIDLKIEGVVALEEEEEDFYHEIDDLIEDDEMSPGELGFMSGYNSA